MVYHFMFGPDYKAGCASCSAIADGFNGIFIHLENHDVALTAVSRAPLERLQAFKQRMGWTFPWASSIGGDFNYDFNVSITEGSSAKVATSITTRGALTRWTRRRFRRSSRRMRPWPALNRSRMCASDRA